MILFMQVPLNGWLKMHIYPGTGPEFYFLIYMCIISFLQTDVHIYLQKEKQRRGGNQVNKVCTQDIEWNKLENITKCNSAY